MNPECSDCGNKVHDTTCRFHHSRKPTKEMKRDVIVDFSKVQDSGARRSFDTGSVRDIRTGKGRYDLISPIALKRLAKHYENGAVKYGDRNWEKGQPLASYMDSLIRHAYVFMAGDRSEDHLAAIAWNAFAVMHTQMMIKESKLPKTFNDLPKAIEELPDAG